MTPRAIADTLLERGLIQNKSRFLLAARWMGVTRRLQAGHYGFSGRLNHYRILTQIARGKVIQEKITFREGLRAREIAMILEETLDVPSDSFLALVYNPVITQSLGIRAYSLEGYLYPDTYFFRRNIPPREVIQTMVSRFKDVFHDSLTGRSASLNLTVHQAVILASIIEGEAVLADERAVISAIYHNRLKRGMRLQACPTIQYLIPDGPRRLLSSDMEIDSPYNTYIHAGLPPGPIGNPGIASIHAALYPDEVPYLYMVANGDGSHTFSRTLEEHVRAKQRFEKIRREVNRRR